MKTDSRLSIRLLSRVLKCVVVSLFIGLLLTPVRGLFAEGGLVSAPFEATDLDTPGQAFPGDDSGFLEHTGVSARVAAVDQVQSAGFVHEAAYEQATDGGYLEDFAWKKDGYRVVPYGSLWGSASYETSRTFPGAYTLFVDSATDQGEDAFHIDTRRTRIGIDVSGPRVPFLHCTKSRGKLEIDFHGAFVVENKPGVLLRHAYAEVYDDSFQLLAGQTWDLISPLNPHTVNYSVGWGGGNIGYRRMQLRYTQYLQFSDSLQVIPAISMNQNIVSDFRATPGVRPEAAGWPLMEGRLGFSLASRHAGIAPATFGFSGHIGAQGFDFADETDDAGNVIRPGIDDARITTWSLNADMRIPLTHRLGVQGEFFTGRDLSTFLGGIVQGVDLDTRTGVHAVGGWFEVWYDLTSRTHLHTGYSVDDPRNSDLRTGKARTYNQFYFVNSIFDVTKNILVGFEVSSWKTNWQNKAPGDSVRFEFSGQYNF